MTALNSGWTFDGVALNSAGAYALRLLSPDEEVPARRGDNLLIPQRHGRVYRAKTFEQRTISLAMWVTGSTPAALQTNLATLQELFGRLGARTLSRTMPDATVRTISAEASQMLLQPQSDKVYAAAVDLLCAAPWWQRTTVATTNQTGIGSSPTSVNLSNPGSAPHVGATITIGGAITNPKVQIGSIWVQYTGAIGGGSSLVLDCENFTTTGGSVANITHSGSTAWMVIPAGASSATLTGTGLSAASLRFDFYPRYF